MEELLPRLAAQATTVLLRASPAWERKSWPGKFTDSTPSAPAPFVAVNCGGIPETLLEAELFGHERGAFTGAVRQKRGWLEQANGGTLFLDEIGDMPIAMQVKLLRVLQERSVRAVGAEQAIPVDFRLICATHRDLRKLVKRGHSAKTCFTASMSSTCSVPPLRDRPEDIIWYARRFLKEMAQEARRTDEGAFRRRPSRRCWRTFGREMCANCATASSVRTC